MPRTKKTYPGGVLLAMLLLVLYEVGSVPAYAQNDVNARNEGALISIPATEANLWSKECFPDSTSDRPACEIVADIYTNTDASVLRIGFGFLGGDNKTTITVITPLGTLLLSGVILQVDDVPAVTFSYLLCTPDGCQVQARVPDALESALRTGKELKIRFFDRTSNPIDITLPLKNFGASLDSLKT
ncbi:MAG: invasion associated locus B family protein [Parvularculales bacterium]